MKHKGFIIELIIYLLCLKIQLPQHSAIRKSKWANMNILVVVTELSHYFHFIKREYGCLQSTQVTTQGSWSIWRNLESGSKTSCLPLQSLLLQIWLVIPMTSKEERGWRHIGRSDPAGPLCQRGLWWTKRGICCARHNTSLHSAHPHCWIAGGMRIPQGAVTQWQPCSKS